MTDPIPTHITDADERRIVTKLVDILLQEGMQLRVFDGEDYATDWTTEAATILTNIAHTDEGHLMVAVPATPETSATMIRNNIGGFLLIFGNGEDVISDMSFIDTASMERLDAIFEQAIA